MRILHVTPFFAPAWRFGGIARASEGLCRALAAAGHDVVALTPRLAPSDPESETRGGVSVVRFDVSGWLARRLVPWSPRLAGWIRERSGSFEIAHLHGHRNGFSVSAGRVCRAEGLPYVLQPHGTLPSHGQHGRLKRIFDLMWGADTLRGAEMLVAVSEAERRDLGRRARLTRNGVEPVAPQRDVRKEPDLLLFVGSDRPQKRGLALLSVLEAVPSARLELVGAFDARFRARFEPWRERVRFSGVLSVDELAAAYARARLLVHPAVGEAFGLAPFEAALHGTAAVVADGHGCGEWFRRAGGCTVPADRPGALAAAIGARLGDAALAAREQEEVARFAGEQLSWTIAAHEMETLYREVVALRRVA